MLCKQSSADSYSQDPGLIWWYDTTTKSSGFLQVGSYNELTNMAGIIKPD